MEALCIKQELIEANSDEERSNLNRVICIKIESECDSEPKLFISSCEDCETPIEPRLAAIKEEPSFPNKTVLKEEPNDIPISVANIKTCCSPAVSSGIKVNNSPVVKSSIKFNNSSAVTSNVKYNNSPAAGSQKWGRNGSCNSCSSTIRNHNSSLPYNSCICIKKSNTPSLSSQKDSVFPYKPKRLAYINDNSFPSHSKRNFSHINARRARHHPYKKFHHRRFKHYRGSSYFTDRPEPWVNNFSSRWKKNKENDYVKDEEKPENGIRIVKLISNNDLSIRINANALREQNHPTNDGPTSSSTPEICDDFQQANSPSSVRNDSENQISPSSVCNIEVNNNITIDHNKDNANDIIECEIDKDNDLDFIHGYSQNLFDIEDDEICTETEKEEDLEIFVTDQNNTSSSRTSSEKDVSVPFLAEVNEVDTDDEMGSNKEPCDSEHHKSLNVEDHLILSEDGKDSEAFLIIDEVNDAEANIEGIKETDMDMEDSEVMKELEEADVEVEDIEIVKEADINMDDTGKSEAEVLKEADTNVKDTEVVETVKEADMDVLKDTHSEVEDGKVMTETETDMDVEVLKDACTEVEVVKEISCHGEIECVFSKMKEAHLCTKCFVEKRRRKKNIDTDIIFLKRKKSKSSSSENIPIISLDENED